MGETVEVSVTKTETSPASLSLNVWKRPSLVVKWIDNAIGKPSRVVARAEFETKNQDLNGVLPIGSVREHIKKNLKSVNSAHVYLRADRYGTVQ